MLKSWAYRKKWRVLMENISVRTKGARAYTMMFILRRGLFILTMF